MDSRGTRLVAGSRTEPLTNSETVRLGRLLTRRLAVEHVSFPDDTLSVVVEVHGYVGDISVEVRKQVAEIIGPFSVHSWSDRP